MEKFTRATIRFCLGIEVDGYQTPSGEYRVGVTSASKVLGFSKEWLGRVQSRGGSTLKAMQGLGFTGNQSEGLVAERTGNGSGASKAITISIDDFALLILYAASKGKKEAVSLQLALTKMSLNDFFRDAFGERPLTLDEKRQLFYHDYTKTMDWMKEDKADWSLIAEQEMFLAENE